MPEKVKLSRGIDAWSTVHLLGCYFLMTLGLSWIQTLAFGILWELCDLVYSVFRHELPEWLSMIFDPRGADLTDIGFDILGIGLFFIVGMICSIL